MRESKIERYLIDEVKRAGGETRKVKWLGRNSAPDRFIMLRGYSAFAELKRPGKEPTDAQAREHLRLKNAGCNVYVLNTIEKIDAFMNNYKRKYGYK